MRREILRRCRVTARSEGLLVLVMVLRGFELFLFSNAQASFSSQTSLYPHLLGSSVTVALVVACSQFIRDCAGAASISSSFCSLLCI